MFYYRYMFEAVIFCVFLFFLGAITGSFLNVLVLRLGTGESIASGRSHCFSCGKVLGPAELIPLFSFIIQRGKCRQCGSRISRQYPLVEFLSGAMFLIIGIKILLKSQAPMTNDQWNALGPGFLNLLGSWDFGLGASLVFFYWASIFSLLLAIAVYDIRHTIIPNRLVYTLAIISLGAPVLQFGICRSFTAPLGLASAALPYILSGIGASLFFATMWFVSGGRWMGFGDAKLALALGFFLGFPGIIVAVTLSFWIGTIFGIVAMTVRRSFVLGMQIPFAPFLVLGAFVSWYWSAQIDYFYWLFSIVV